MSVPQGSEPQAVVDRYARRDVGDRYSMLRPDVWQSVQERQRAMLRLFARLGWRDLAELRLTEVGCGGGGNLLEMLRLGLRADHLTGIELLPERCAQARLALPQAAALIEGDAMRAAIEPGSQHVVFVSTVFSSLLDDAFQQALAERMWQWVQPGGGVLWYDFTVDNPRNADVRGVPLSRVRHLFPRGRVQSRRVTLAPPIARRVAAVHPSLYTLFNLLPLLRTHVLCWIAKD
jgi:SAM-dependent methyltransferase